MSNLKNGLEKVANAIIDKCSKDGIVSDNDLLFFAMFKKQLLTNNNLTISSFVKAANKVIQSINKELDSENDNRSNENDSEVL